FQRCSKHRQRFHSLCCYGDTVTVKLVGVQLEPSFTYNVTVALPYALAAGLAVTVREEPEPPKVTFAFGIRLVLDEYAETDRELADVSRSPTVNGSAAVVEFFAIVVLETDEIVGGVLRL